MLAFFMYIIYRYFKVQRWTREERPARIAPWENNANIIDDRQKQKTKSSKHNICPIISNNNSLLKQFLKRKGTRLLRFDGEIKRKVSPSVELVACWKKKEILERSPRLFATKSSLLITFRFRPSWTLLESFTNTNTTTTTTTTTLSFDCKIRWWMFRYDRATILQAKDISFSFHATTNNTQQSTG